MMNRIAPILLALFCSPGVHAAQVYRRITADYRTGEFLSSCRIAAESASAHALRRVTTPRPTPDAPHAPHTLRTGPGYCATRSSEVNSVIPSTRACATKRRSKGSLWIGGNPSIATA